MTLVRETLLPLLVHIQANLDGDLSLGALARRVHLSPWHLHRSFKAAIGETPKQHVARLRLERSSFRMSIHETTLLQIALDCGYRNHETFARAFRRQFGRSPSEYRQWVARRVSREKNPRRPESVADTQGYELSSTKVARLRSMHLAFVRHVGPYESVPDSLFDILDRWATRHRLLGPRTWLGLGHDAPGRTEAHNLRFDAALVVPAAFRPEVRIACQFLAGGEFAVTTHVGPFDTLPSAYAEIFPRALALRGYRLVGLPVIEIYRTSKVSARRRMNHTDIYLPLAARTVA